MKREPAPRTAAVNTAPRTIRPRRPPRLWSLRSFRSLRPGPVAARECPDGRAAAVVVGDVSRETCASVCSAPSSIASDPSRDPPNHVGVARDSGAVAPSRASAASAASIRPAISAGMRGGPGRLPSRPRISSSESWTSAQSSHASRWRRTSAVLDGERRPSVRSEISATSGCSAVSVVDVTLAHLRPSQQLNRSALHPRDPRLGVPLPVGRMSPAPGSVLRPVPCRRRLFPAGDG